MKAVQLSGGRILTTLAWVLAIVVPGGLPLLALWVTFKAARDRSLLAREHASDLGATGPQPVQG